MSLESDAAVHTPDQTPASEVAPIERPTLHHVVVSRVRDMIIEEKKMHELDPDVRDMLIKIRRLEEDEKQLRDMIIEEKKLHELDPNDRDRLIRIRRFEEDEKTAARQNHRRKKNARTRLQ